MKINEFESLQAGYLKQHEGMVNMKQFSEWANDKDAQFKEFDKVVSAVTSLGLLDEAKNFILSHDGESIVRQLAWAIDIITFAHFLVGDTVIFDGSTQLHICKCDGFSKSPLLANGERACSHVIAVFLRSALEQRACSDIEDDKKVGK